MNLIYNHFLNEIHLLSIQFCFVSKFGTELNFGCVSESTVLGLRLGKEN